MEKREGGGGKESECESGRKSEEDLSAKKFSESEKWWIRVGHTSERKSGGVLGGSGTHMCVTECEEAFRESVVEQRRNYLGTFESLLSHTDTIPTPGHCSTEWKSAAVDLESQVAALNERNSEVSE